MVGWVTYKELYSWLFLTGKTVEHPKLYSIPTNLFAKSPDSLQHQT